jgi:transposase-like protein
MNRFLYNSDEGKALALARWPEIVACPRCGRSEKVYPLKTRPLNWVCTPCGKRRFSVTSSSVFENTKIELSIWFEAIRVLQTQPDISVLELSRRINVGSYKQAWAMARKLALAAELDDAALGRLTTNISVESVQKATPPYRLYMESNPLRMWRNANGISAKSLGAQIGVSPATILAEWEWRGIPKSRLAQVEDFARSELGEPEGRWKNDGPLEAPSRWIERAQETIVAKAVGQGSVIRAMAEIRIRTKARVARVEAEMRSDREIADRWIADHADELAGFKADWRLAHAYDLNQTINDCGERDDGFVSRMMFGHFQRDGDYLSLEDYVIDKLDSEGTA